jgi:hypothetical protein
MRKLDEKRVPKRLEQRWKIIMKYTHYEKYTVLIWHKTGSSCWILSAVLNIQWPESKDHLSVTWNQLNSACTSQNWQVSGLMWNKTNHTSSCRHAVGAEHCITDNSLVLRIKGVKLSRYHHAGAKGERSYSSYSVLTSELDGVSGQRHALAALYPRERCPGTHWIGSWVGLRAGLGTEARGKLLCLCRGSNLGRSVCSQTLYWPSYPGSCLRDNSFNFGMSYLHYFLKAR